MQAKIIFTDPNHEHQTRTIDDAMHIPGATTMHISNVPSTEGFHGFGVAITGASCFLLSQMDKPARTALLKSIYTNEGLGLSVGRLTIGASDYSKELYSYDDVPFDTALKHFSIERDQAYILPMLKEILAVNPNLTLFASPWSPPGWMKTGGKMCGGYMRDESINCYADYIVKFIETYHATGIPIAALTPQNEPETQQNGRMPACIWHPETEAKFIHALKERLNTHELDVKIWMHDHNFNSTERVLWALENHPYLQKDCAGVAFHYYGGVIEETLKIKKDYPNLELHFTEGGPRLSDHYDTDWCKWSSMMIKTLCCGYRSFTGWNLMLDETGGPNIGPFLCGGLITRHSETGELSFSGQFKAFSHMAPYINPDSKIHPMQMDPSGNASMSDYPKNPKAVEGILIANPQNNVVVLVNPNKEKHQTQFFLNEKWWYAELLPNSVSTILLPAT